jgi:monofunctional biosynthetic peptidoglycan transglycosylase
MMKRRTFLLWLIAVPAALILLLQLWYFVQVCWWVNHNPQSTAFMREQLTKLREKNPNAQLQHQWVPYSRVSNHLKRAIIASEDANFAEHEGVDWEALQKAYEKNAKKGKVVRGGSTITQQLAKNLFLSGERSYVRKVQEMLITYMIEAVMDKRRIFEIYLNSVEWGSGVFGCEAASRKYFGVPAAGLGPGEAARLAVMLPNPRFFGRHLDSNYLSRRSALILIRMNSADLP